MAPPKKWRNEASTPTYYAWANMRNRCSNPRKKDYHGRGITVDPRWIDDFDAFVDDMGIRPEGLTLERVNNDRGYGPDNCVWATRTTQQRNRRRNRYFTFQGMTKTLTELASDAGISFELAAWRIKQGWSLERTFRPTMRYDL